MGRSKTWIAALVCLTAASYVHAGTVVKFERKPLDPTAKGGTGVFYLENDRARVEFKGDEAEGIVIYSAEDKDNPRLWLIDQNQWTYVEVFKKDMKKLQGHMLDRLEMMNQQLQQMPKEQREEIMKRFRGEMDQLKEIAEPRDKSKLKYEKVEEKAKLEQWTSSHYKCFFGDEIEDEAWVVAWADLGVGHEDVAVIADMDENFGALSGMSFFANLWEKGGVAGFPMRTVSYRDGKEMEETKIGEIQKVEVDPSKFALPDKLTKRDFMQ